MTKTCKIFMRDMEFYGYIGCLPFEKENGQRFVISCEMELSDMTGAESDSLEDTVNYAEVYDLIKDKTENARCDLIERLADDLAESVLLSSPLIAKATVRVSKPDAPIDGKFGAMEAEVTAQR